METQNIKIENLSKKTVEKLKAKAKKEHRSMNGQAKHIIEESLK